jgi:hypothetical protein
VVTWYAADYRPGYDVGELLRLVKSAGLFFRQRSTMRTRIDGTGVIAAARAGETMAAILNED